MSNRKKVENIFYKALNEVKADNIIKNSISLEDGVLKIVDNKIPLESFNNLYVFSVGKAGYDMAKACEDILKDKIHGGVAVSLKSKKLNHIKHFTSTHPQISLKSLKCAEKIIDEVKKLKGDDLYIFLLSGGASAMIEKPIEGMLLKDFQQINESLLISGIDIKALNTVRKSISSIKGGKLGDMFKSKGYVLVLSDVIGDDLNTIGSAPMYKKANNKKIPHYVVANNKLALKSAKEYLKKDVQKTKILTTTLNMSSKKAAEYISKSIKKYNEKYDSYCLFIGGETRVKVKGEGKGGRNSELALRLVINKAVKKDMTILCAGSDGVDGSSDSNGAFIDREIYKKIKEKALDPKEYLKNSDSHTFFKQTGYEFYTGITGTNVMDFVIIYKNKK